MTSTTDANISYLKLEIEHKIFRLEKENMRTIEEKHTSSSLQTIRVNKRIKRNC